jgi:hypothetical protein
VLDPPLAAGVLWGSTGDHVEAHPSNVATVLLQPGGCRADHSRLLAAVDRELRPSESRRASSLDLDEGDHRTSRRDQIDLDSADPDVAFGNAIPSTRQKAGCTGLALGTESPILVGCAFVVCARA